MRIHQDAVGVIASTYIPSALERAREFAIKSHGSQMYGNVPYVAHLDDVFSALCEFGCKNEDLLQAAYLHDVLEDTPVTFAELLDAFGRDVALLVYRLTKTPGGSRKTRARESLGLISECREAIQIKLADRIANVRQCIASKDWRLDMYRKEYDQFRHMLHNPQDRELFGMWEELDCLMEAAHVGER